MINRLRAIQEEPEQPKPPEDYFEIRARFDTYYVSREVGERVLGLRPRATARAAPPHLAIAGALRAAP